MNMSARLHVTVSTVPQLDSSTSKIGAAVGISFLCAMELEISLGCVVYSMSITLLGNWLHRCTILYKNRARAFVYLVTLAAV